jgi:predicted AAA+ superfamily ATPase
MAPEAYLRRYVDDYLDRAMDHLPAFMITGPRACGKTTTAARRAASVLSLDDPGQASLFAGQPDVVLGSLEPPVLIDEWQEAAESLGAVKRAVDASSGAGRFLITGSVRARHTGVTWPGTGRVTPVRMYPLARGELVAAGRAASFVERLFAREIAVGRLTDAPTIFDYVSFAVAGGFPESVHLPPDLRGDWFDGYVEQLVGRDVGQIADVREPRRLESLLRALALSTAGTPTKAALARASATDHKTMDRYSELLEELGIIERLPAWGTNRLRRMIKLPKVHLVDTGMAAHLARADAASVLRDGELRGRLLESFVTAQLRPLLRIGASRATAHHLRDADNRREVDLVLEDRSGQIVGIEVKAAAGATPKDARHLVWLRDAIGDDFRCGVVFHTGDTAYPVTDRVWALPIAAIWS